MSAKAQVPPFATMQIGALPVIRHVLDAEAEKMARLSKRLGKRLDFQLRTLPAGVIPDEEFRETFKVYQAAVFGLLREQRARAAVAGNQQPVTLTPEEERQEMEAIARDVLRSSSAEDRRRLLDACAIDVTPPPQPQVEHDIHVPDDFDYTEKP